MNTVIFPEDVANAVQSAYLQTEDEDARNLLLSVGAEVEYLGDREIDYNDGTEVSWECPVCKAFGKALYHDTFLQHDSVMDGNGDCVHDRV